jgi:16S rRNA (cytosine1402-N4)-methyltransferase
MAQEPRHLPVMPQQAVDLLAVKQGGTYADLTLGLGGHAELVMRLMGPDGWLIGVDKDEAAIALASKRLGGLTGRLTIIRADFRDAPRLIARNCTGSLDGFLMDLGVSTMQLKSPGRGFGFMEDAPLDMRMDTTSGVTAETIVNDTPEAGLASIIFKYGEERWAKAIAKKIAERRETSPITTTGALAKAVMDAIPRKAWPEKTHPATRTFQAIRIAVNDELGALIEGLEGMLGILAPGGRAVVISYHSLEDRIVKQTFRRWETGCTCPPDFPACVCGNRPRLRLVTKRPVLPDEEEIKANPSARSAKLRAAERI